MIAVYHKNGIQRSFPRLQVDSKNGSQASLPTPRLQVDSTNGSQASLRLIQYNRLNEKECERRMGAQPQLGRKVVEFKKEELEIYF